MLTDTKLRALKPKDALYRVADAGGLAVEVPPQGGLRWRWRYRFDGKAKMVSLGCYPDVSLAHARQRRDDARRALAKGIDPSAERRDAKQAKSEAEAVAADTFETVAREWMARQDVADVTASKTRWLMDTCLFPAIGARPIAAITPRELLDALRVVEATGKLETAQRAKIKAGQVFRYAVLEGRAEIDPTASLRNALKSPKAKHHAAITDPLRIGELLRAIDGFTGQPVTLAAMKLAPLVFVRPGELRHAEWAEFDLDAELGQDEE